MSRTINNLKIKYNKDTKMYEVITPYKRVLEEFESEGDAIKFAVDTKDFVVRRES